MKPQIAIISNSQTPYRLALHQRIVAEIPEVALWSLYTHEKSNAAWEFVAPPEINPVLFGKGENSGDADKPGNVLREWKRAGKIIAWMKEHEIRFVVMMGYNDAGRMRMIRWCRRNKIPCFLFGDSNIHGDVRGGAKAIVKKAVVGRVVKSVTGIFSCGSLGKLYFEKYGAKPDRIFYFPYEPDYALVQNLSGEEIDNAKSKYDLQNNRQRIVYSGRLVSVKRVDMLIDAFKTIASQRPDWDLVLIGDGPLRSELEAKIPADLKPRVKFLGFMDDQKTISGIYRASDVLVLPSDYEPWALVINEAAAAGMAIVSSNVVGAAAELVRDGVNGRLFSPGDKAELASCLLDVTDPDKIESMKSASLRVLADWRKRGDPVQGLHSALQSVGVIP